MGKTYRKRSKRRTRKRRCKHGKLKRSVRTKRGGRRRCKKKKRKSKRKRRHKMGDCPTGMVEDIQNCGYYTPCKDQYGICRTKRGKRLSEVMSLQELATRRLLKRNTKEPVFTLNYNLPKQPPLAPKGYYLTSPTYPGRQIDIRSIQTMRDMEERDRVTKDLSKLLLKAIRDGNTEMVRMLINRGVDVDIEQEEIFRDEEDEEDEIDDDMFEIETEAGQTALMIASRRGRIEIVEMLIKAGANMNAKDFDGNTALFVDPDMSIDPIVETDIATLLIENGANMNIKNFSGNTALMFAIMFSSYRVAKLLIEKGADMETKNNKGNTALMEASNFNRIEIVTLLIEKGADVNAKNDKDGSTALMIASNRGYTELVTLLIEAGADVDETDRKGRSAIEYAISKGHTEIARLLKQEQTEALIKHLKDSGYDSDSDVVRMLLR